MLARLFSIWFYKALKPSLEVPQNTHCLFSIWFYKALKPLCESCFLPASLFSIWFYKALKLVSDSDNPQIVCLVSGFTRLSNLKYL